MFPFSRTHVTVTDELEVALLSAGDVIATSGGEPLLITTDFVSESVPFVQDTVIVFAPVLEVGRSPDW